MAAKNKLNIVVDACIARSVSKTEVPKRPSKQCYLLLQEIEQQGHQLVFNKKLTEEWKKHASGTYAVGTFLPKLIARNLLVRVDGESPLGTNLVAQHQSEKDRKEMEKDRHLIDAGILGHAEIVSREKNSLKRFVDASQILRVRLPLTWFNPELHETKIRDFLMNAKTRNGFGMNQKHPDVQ